MSDPTIDRERTLAEQLRNLPMTRLGGLVQQLAALAAERDALEAECATLTNEAVMDESTLFELGAECDALAASVARVRALHIVRGRECSECYGFYPCPTIRALDGTP